MSRRLRAALGICTRERCFVLSQPGSLKCASSNAPKQPQPPLESTTLPLCVGRWSRAVSMVPHSRSSEDRSLGILDWRCHVLPSSPHHWRLVWMVPITPKGLALYDDHWIPAPSRQQYFPFLKHSQVSGLLETSLTRGKCTMPAPSPIPPLRQTLEAAT